ncbi:hypothetical protein SCLCIDRAFT_30957 [Scleroderma citrinum Foug A]|uniref:Ubiquitin-like domain-containing protein n=1 Tax=Scleroderma citrinum Foug A TaxID=1036808 RepID=A0A0C2ZQ10_9AGAM|nr:hypothetical protein SCLCIDRAFT_30957 [Scleroderma citrinum Foug A]
MEVVIVSSNLQSLEPIYEDEDEFAPFDPDISDQWAGILSSGFRYSEDEDDINSVDRDAVETFNIDILNSSDEGSGATSESDIPPIIHKPVKKLVRQPCKKARQGKTSTKQVPMYDPQTCAFMIQCTVHQSNGTNVPFKISSGVSLSQLRLVVSEKLGCFTDHLILQYRLDSDKAKMGTTSIQADSKLDIFLAKMRSMIVPPHLANGKLSTCTPKNVVVYFEDAATTNALNETHDVLILSVLIFKTKLFVSMEW